MILKRKNLHNDKYEKEHLKNDDFWKGNLINDTSEQDRTEKRQVLKRKSEENKTEQETSEQWQFRKGNIWKKEKHIRKNNLENDATTRKGKSENYNSDQEQAEHW